MRSNCVIGPGCFFYFCIFSPELVNSCQFSNHEIDTKNMGIPSITIVLSSSCLSNYSNYFLSLLAIIDLPKFETSVLLTVTESTSSIYFAYLEIFSTFSLRSLPNKLSRISGLTRPCKYDALYSMKCD